MRNFPYPRFLVSQVLIGILTACTLLSSRVPTTGTETPFAAGSPTPTGTATLLPTEPLPSLTPTPEYAPICESDATSVPTPAACQLPLAEQSSVFCTNKVPYNLILINAGSTYEVLSDGVTCTDAGIKDEKELVTCTGAMASAFQLRVCDPACAIPTVQAVITQCPQQYTFDSLRGCCAQGEQPAGQNCTVLDLAITSCVVDCGVFTDEDDCDENSNACVWDADDNVCGLRR
jgi:hypothetical protein